MHLIHPQHPSLQKLQVVNNPKLPELGPGVGQFLIAEWVNFRVLRPLKAAVLNVGGLSSYGAPRPEVDYINYTPRITLPVLMLNGRYDLALRLDSEFQPMFELLGTPDGHKRLIVYETDHWIDRKEVTRETLAWLDIYLGPVQ